MGIDKNPVALFAASDMYQLLSGFVFQTTPELAESIGDGRFVEDAKNIMRELGFTDAERKELAVRLNALQCDGGAREDLFHAVRVDYTRLLANPKISVMTPYEARFLHTEDQVEGASIPLGKIVLDADARYKQAGFTSAITPKERADHMGVELEFMQVLRKNQGIALREGDESAFAEIDETVQEFLQSHLGVWAIEFFTELGCQANEDTYRVIADLAVAFFRCELGR